MTTSRVKPINYYQSFEFYSDLDIGFDNNKNTGDVYKISDEYAVSNALKNLIYLEKGDVPFNYNLGSDVRSLLFELPSLIISSALSSELELLIKNYEPRVTLPKPVGVKYNSGDDSYTIIIYFSLINKPETLYNVNFNIERLR